MIVCIDTNAFVQLFGKHSRFRVIAAALMGARIELAVSSAISHPRPGVRRISNLPFARALQKRGRIQTISKDLRSRSVLAYKSLHAALRADP